MKLGALLKWGFLMKGLFWKGHLRKFAVKHFDNE
jgi:hypothetical protein